MKLREFEQFEPHVIRGNVKVEEHIRHLDYHGKVVYGDFYCNRTKITSLDGCPKRVTGYFDCTHTSITSLKGCPRRVDSFFFCNQTDIKTLHNVHKMIDYLGEFIYIPNIASHILGLLKIRGLKSVGCGFNIGPVFTSTAIMNSYLVDKPNPRDRDIQKCQEELIEAGLAKYAQL